MREGLVAAEGLEPAACKSRPGGDQAHAFHLALLCSALPCLALLDFALALWLVDPLVLLLFCFMCSFFLLAGLLACLLVSFLPALLVSLSAGLLAGWLA